MTGHYLVFSVWVVGFVACLVMKGIVTATAKKNAAGLGSIVFLTLSYYHLVWMVLLIHSESYLDRLALVFNLAISYPAFLLLYFAAKNVSLYGKDLSNHWKETTADEKRKASRGWIWIWIGVMSCLSLVTTFQLPGLIGVTLFLILFIGKEKWCKSKK